MTPVSIASPTIAKLCADGTPLGSRELSVSAASLKARARSMIKLADGVARLLPARRRRDGSGDDRPVHARVRDDGGHEAPPELRRQQRRRSDRDDHLPPRRHPEMATTTAPIHVASARRTAALRAWLAASGYDAPGVRTLLGATTTSLVDAVVAPAARRRLAVADTPSAVLARLFLLGDEVCAGEAARRLGPLADELIALGLVTATGTVAAPRRPAGAARPPADRQRPAGRGRHRPCRRRAPPVGAAGRPDGAPARPARARRGHRKRHPGAAGRRPCRPRRRDRHQRARAGLRRVQLRAERRRERRVPARQPARTRAGRAVRPGRREPAVRDLARPRRRLPRLGHGARRRLRDRSSAACPTCSSWAASRRC